MLLEAIAKGKSWLTDESNLRRLSNQTTVQQLRQQLDAYLKIWNSPAMTISLQYIPGPDGLYATVARYDLHSIAALEERLSQFPPGTKFILRSPGPPSPASDKLHADVRDFLIAHGFGIEK